ncbi:MAG: hypothetical protein ABW201_05955 [Candidatus Thiodiazotropha sp.]
MDREGQPTLNKWEAVDKVFDISAILLASQTILVTTQSIVFW